MKPAHRWLALLAAVVPALAVVACTNGSSAQATKPPAQSSCASVSKLVVYTYTDSQFTGYGLARAWHVWFSAFGPVTSGEAVIADYLGGLPTKVVIHPDPDMKQTVQLTGKDCSTGTALHFCYQQDNCGFAGQSFTVDELSRLGTDHLVIVPIGGVRDYTGYILFPGTGSYLLSVMSGPNTLGSVTLGVSRQGA